MIVAADPLVTVANKTPRRFNFTRGDADDGQPRQQSVRNRERNDARIELTERHSPFHRQRTQPIVFLLEQVRKIPRFDAKTIGERRRWRGAQFGETVDNVLGRR